MGVAKTTVARIETLEMSARAEFITKAMRVFRQNGVDVDLYEPDGIVLNIKAVVIDKALADLIDVDQRRSDRHAGMASVLPVMEDLV